MKFSVMTMVTIILLAGVNCSNVSPDAAELDVDFDWIGFVSCVLGELPELRISGIPVDTKTLEVSLTDHGLSHGRQTIAYDGSGIIKKGVLDKIEPPCPMGDPGKYKFKVKALNADGVVIGIGSKQRYYPESQ